MDENLFATDREAWDAQRKQERIDERRKMVKEAVAQVLNMAGEVCYHAVEEDPDLLEWIGKGICEFLNAGEIFNSAMVPVMEFYEVEYEDWRK